MTHREIFTAKYLREKRNLLDLQNPKDVPNLEKIRQHIADWQTSFQNGTILRQSEIQLQKEFLTTFFAGCLGFKTKIGRNDWELDYESTTDVDATRADGYLGAFTPTTRKITAVIELKDANCDLDRPQNRKNDKRTPVEQAFSYASKVGADCRWVIVSNFLEIRMYHASDQGRFEYFHITQLHLDEQLWRFLFLLHRDRLLPHGPESFLEHFHRERLEQELTISIDFYKEFKAQRHALFTHLKTQNPGKSELLLFEKTQKLLDRLIFVFFCEDKGLLPFDISRKVGQAARASLDPTGGQNVWSQIRGLFRSIDKGNPPQNINRYNGGLFAHDPELDDLQILDNMAEVLLRLARFDFDSDLNVNILGHIFEQSISDIEEIKAEIAGTATDKKQGKRKKDGIFYTPEYITRYIVRQAVGGWLDDRKREIGFDDLPELSETDFSSIKMLQSGPRKGIVEGNAAVERHRAAWSNYREALSKIKILDPACGSGAFLIQVFDFLRGEQQAVNDEIARLSLGLRSIEDLSRHILTHNIFGVDINQESVEITKLALWLKTADNQSELTALDQNIRCGNSLIDDPAVAGNLAFDWKRQFSAVFGENGGFDVVVGNPPYLFGRDWKYDDGRSYQYFLANYEVADYQFDMYVLFYERAIKLLSKTGKLGFITPNTWLNNQKTVKLRQFILSKTDFDVLADYTEVNVFKDAVVLPIVTILSLQKRMGNVVKIEKAILEIAPEPFSTIEQAVWEKDELKIINFNLNQNDVALVEKLETGSKKLLDFAIVRKGIQIYETGKGTPPQKAEDAKNKIFESDFKVDDSYRPFLEGKDIETYQLRYQNRWLKYGKNLASPRDSVLFEGQRLVVRRIVGDRLIATFIEGDFTASQLLQTVKPFQPEISKYLLAILNSSLIAFYFRKKYNRLDKTFPEIRVYELESLPIKEITPEKQQPFIALADQMLALHKTLHVLKTRFLQLLQTEMNIEKPSRALENWEMLDFKTFAAELAKQKKVLSLGQKSEWLAHFETERTAAQKIHDALRSTDQKIDGLVFDLYGLTGEERAMVLGK